MSNLCRQTYKISASSPISVTYMSEYVRHQLDLNVNSNLSKTINIPLPVVDSLEFQFFPSFSQMRISLAWYDYHYEDK